MDWETNTIQGITPANAVKFTVDGEPRSKQRPRVARGRAYTPKETVAAEKLVAEAYRAASEHLFEHHVIVSIDFFNGNRRRRDLDNMAKLVMDALNGVAFVDDFQVVELNLRKFFTDKERARTEVRLVEVVTWPSEREAIPEVPGP